MLDLQHYLQKKTFTPTPEKEAALDDKTVFSVFQSVIESEYGIRGRSHIEPKFYKEKKLFVGFKSSLWASEVWLNREGLKEKTNTLLGFQGIQEIKVSMN